MKSSSNLSETSSKSVRAWMPAEFAAPQESHQSAAQQLLDIFTPQPGQMQLEANENPRLIQAGSSNQERLKSWDPGDFSQHVAANQKAARSPTQILKGSPDAPASFDAIFPTFAPRAAQRPPERRGEHHQERIPEMHTQIEYVVDETRQAEFMADARDRADQLLQQARESAAQIIAQAKEDARKAVGEGFSQGQAEGLAEAASSIRAAQAMIAETASWRDQVVAQSEEAVVDMIRRIARLMFGEGLQLDKSALQIYLNEVMETTRSLGELNIFLSPVDYSQLDSAWAEYYTQIRGIRVTVIGSSNILPGGCYVQGQMGTVDARIETKLDAVMGTLADETESGAAE